MILGEFCKNKWFYIKYKGNILVRKHIWSVTVCLLLILDLTI